MHGDCGFTGELARSLSRTALKVAALTNFFGIFVSLYAKGDGAGVLRLTIEIS